MAWHLSGCQTITYTDGEILSTGPLGTNSIEIESNYNPEDNICFISFCIWYLLWLSRLQVVLSEEHLISTCSDYNHVRSWSVTRFRGMISTQPGSMPLASFKVASLDYMHPMAQHSAGNDIGNWIHYFPCLLICCSIRLSGISFYDSIRRWSEAVLFWWQWVKFLSIRDHFVYAANQWEATLQCNVVSHWLGTYTKWSLSIPFVIPGPFGEKDAQQVFVQKVVPDTDTVFIRFASTGKR